MNILKTGLLLLVGFFLLGCNLFIRTPGMDGNVQINLSVQESRTVIPEVSPEIIEYRITFSEGPETVSPVTTSNDSVNLDLPQGTWTITIEGLNLSGLVVASGSESGIVVTTDDITYVSIALSATTAGTGSIDITVDWSAADSASVVSVSATLDGVAIESSKLERIEKSVRYTEDIISSGSYMLFFHLDTNVVVAEAVQVYDNLTSSSSIYLDNDDFNSVPTVPGNLSAIAVSSTQINIEWDDNSNNELGFKIERSTDGISFTQIVEVSAGIASYSDTGLNASTLYYYQVRAYNTEGESVYSNTTNVITNPVSSSQIIADHTVVDQYNQIPPEYLAIVKTMLVDIAGESHSSGYRIGMDLLESYNSNYVSTTFDGTRPAITSTALRIGRHGSVGEQGFYTNTVAITNIKAHIQSQHDSSNPYHIIGFGWCWDMTWHNNPGGTRDPIYQVRWAGSSVGGPEDDLIWGLDAGDLSLTGNSVCMDSYLNAMEEYITYCETNGLACKPIFTTGPVDGNNNNENGYQREIKHDYIRSYVQADSTRILFDYADILCYNNSGSENIATWDDDGTPRSYSQIHPDNMMDYDGDFDHTTSHSEDGDHIGEVGAMRLAKAMWWMLARVAGWDGN